MNVQSKNFWSVILRLWRNLAAIATAVCFCLGICQISVRVSGWSISYNLLEITFEVALRLLFSAILGLALGTAGTLASAPVLLLDPSRRRIHAQNIKSTASIVGMALCVAYLLWTLARPKLIFEPLPVPPAIAAGLWVVYCVAMAGILFVPRARKRVIAVVEPGLDSVTSRRSMIVAGISTAVVIGTELSVSRRAPPPLVRPAATRLPNAPNILLITFDALAAEELSVYGYSRPTTPNLDAFARSASVFENYYAIGTFTTPSIATMMTGRYPCESHIVNFQDKLRGQDHRQVLPALLRDAGYDTAASVSNLAAFGLVQQLEEYFDLLPDRPRKPGASTALWSAARVLHPRGAGALMAEMFEGESRASVVIRLLQEVAPNRFAQSGSQDHPRLAFAQGLRLLERLKMPYFLWIHVYAPHGPYLPGPPFLGRFGRPAQVSIEQEESTYPGSGSYRPEQQGAINRLRIRYDEWLAETDHALGDFLRHAEKRHLMKNTAVLVSADHGESFTGGIFQHGSACLSRPQLHIPLLIQTPSQTRQSRVYFTADQTSLVPTILDIAGVLPFPGMRGPSLVPWCGRDGVGGGEGLAFAQYLFGNPSAGPYREGTAGIIASGQQYYVRLEHDREYLRPLSEAHMAYLDRSADNRSVARDMRERVFGGCPA